MGISKKTQWTTGALCIALLTVLFLALQQSEKGVERVDEQSAERGEEETSVKREATSDSLQAPTQESSVRLNDVAIQSVSQATEGAEVSGGVLIGRITSPLGEPLSDIEVKVELWKADPRFSKSNEQGVYKLTDLPVGQPFGVRVGWGSVPAGMMSPAQWSSGYEGATVFRMNWPVGFYDGVLQIEDATVPKECNVQFLHEVVVRGKLIRAQDLSPIVGGRVRLTAWTLQEPQPQGTTVQTNIHGEFSAKVTAGVFKIYFETSWSGVPEDLFLPGIAPTSFTVSDGEVRDLGIFEFGGGENSITGKVLDQYGMPIVGLKVLAFVGEPTEQGEPPNTMGAMLGRAVTDSKGIYKFTGLFPGRVAIRAGPYDYERKGEIEGKRLATFSPTTRVHVTGEACEFNAPEITAEISEPFTVNLTIRHETEGESITGADVSLRALDKESPSYGLPKFFGCSGEVQVIQWACRTPNQPFQLRLKNGMRELNHSQVIEPTPNGKFEATLYVR